MGVVREATIELVKSYIVSPFQADSFSTRQFFAFFL
jgi:hypothetical protein